MKRIKESIGIKFFLIMLLLLSGCSLLIYLFIAMALPVQYEDYIVRKEQCEADDFYNGISGKTYGEASNLIYEKCITGNRSILIFKDKKLVNEVPYGNGEIEIRQYGSYVEDDDVYVYVLGGNRVTDWFSAAQHSPGIMEDEYLKSNGKSWIGPSVDGKGEGHYVKSALALCDGSTYSMYTSYVSQPIIDAGNVLAEIFRYVLPVILFVSALAAFLYSGIVAGPIISLSKSAKRMANMDLDVRCVAKRKDEIGVLADSLNELAVNLSASLKELKQQNESLQSEVETERELDKKRKDFFNMASHELKTPITVLRGYIEGMLYGIGVYRDRDEYLEKSLVKLEQMEQLVRELLNISKLEQVNPPYGNNACDIREVINGVIAELAELQEKGNIRIQNRIQDSVLICADKTHMYRVMMNIIKNAVTYSPGGAQVTVCKKEAESCVKISVVNTDTHIPEEELPFLFQPFYRIDKSRNRNNGGSGLGLYIISIILDSYKLKYEMENTDEGVEFSIWIPNLQCN